MLRRQNEELKRQAALEQDYLRQMFDRTKQEGLARMVREWEGMRSLGEQAREGHKSGRGSDAEGGGKVLSDYSGAIIQLKDLYAIMSNSVVYDRQGDFGLDVKAEAVVEKIEHEVQAKIKDVQQATAKRVLRRFYKKIEFAEAGTNVDEDPVELEKQRLERVIEHLRSDRDNDMKRIVQLQAQVDSMNKVHNALTVQFREAKTLLNQRGDELAQREGELKEGRAQHKYLNEQVLKTQEQVKELMYKCDDYENRLDMYKESLQILDRKHQGRRAKKQALKREK